MSRNSIEKRSVLQEKNWIRESRYNPESSTSIVLSPKMPTKNLKRQQSMGVIDTHDKEETLENRYTSLKKMYKNLLTKVSQSETSKDEQKKQIERLRKIHEKNQQEIKKLRGMLGFLQKKDQCTQTSNKQQFPVQKTIIDPSLRRSVPKLSTHSSKEFSQMSTPVKSLKISESLTQINLYNSPKNSTMKMTDPNRGGSWLAKSSKHLLIKTAKHELKQSQFRTTARMDKQEGLKNRYKFVPSVALE